MAHEPAPMERNINTVIDVFHKYSKKGNPDTLSQEEFKQLVNTELQNFLKNENKDEEAINHILEDLDTNLDKELSFEEFAMLIAKLIHASHEEMHKNASCKEGHCHGPGLGGVL